MNNPLPFALQWLPHLILTAVQQSNETDAITIPFYTEEILSTCDMDHCPLKTM